MKVKDNNRIVQLLIIGAITVTLIITPNLNKDSLIIPKVIILFCLALFLTPILIRTIRDSLKNSFIKVLVALILIWFFYSLLIILNSESPIEQLLFGRTGRGLGFITFSSVVVLTLAASLFIDIKNLKPLI